MTNSNDDKYIKKYYEPIGANGELLLEFTLYDAITSGFDQIIFIASKEIKKLLKSTIDRRFMGKVKVLWVNSNPQSFFGLRRRVPNEFFEKNTYALWKARKYLTDPFLVVDAKYYHGRRSFERAKNFLSINRDDFGSISLPLGKTLSSYGAVDRTVCYFKKSGQDLMRFLELEKIRRVNGSLNYSQPSSLWISEDIPSTDMFCLNNRIFEAYDLQKEKTDKTGEKPTKKSTLTNLINLLLERKKIKVKVLVVNTDWFSTQFKPERILASSKIQQMISQKWYPKNLE